MIDPVRTGSSEPHGWSDANWDSLLQDIRHQRCTPFLGAGACAGVVPLGKEIALDWAEKYSYPFADRDNLARVAQFVAINHGSGGYPQGELVDRFRELPVPDFTNPNEPHRVVADLRLPIYLTTNYDDFMMQALSRDDRQPRKVVCKWNRVLPGESIAAEPFLDPSRERPVVFHLHGSLEDEESMVLTEDDFLDFLMLTTKESSLLPPRIQQAFSNSTLLFLGYSLEDLSFKVLFRQLCSVRRRRLHVSVQLGPESGMAEAQCDYIRKQFEAQSVKVYFGSCQQFAAELRRRREAQ